MAENPFENMVITSQHIIIFDGNEMINSSERSFIIRPCPFLKSRLLCPRFDDHRIESDENLATLQPTLPWVGVAAEKLADFLVSRLVSSFIRDLLNHN